MLQIIGRSIKYIKLLQVAFSSFLEYFQFDGGDLCLAWSTNFNPPFACIYNQLRTVSMSFLVQQIVLFPANFHMNNAKKMKKRDVSEILDPPTRFIITSMRKATLYLLYELNSNVRRD